MDAGQCWQRSGLAYHSGGGEYSACSLAQILQPAVAPKYSLSCRAAAGILRRAARRNRELPDPLRLALEAISCSTTEAGGGAPPPADDNGTNMLLTAPAVTPGARRASGNRGGEQVIAYQCCGNEVSQQLSLRSGAASLPGGVPFIVNAAESCARRDHARQADTARSLDSTGGFAANQGGTVVQESLTVRRLTPTEALRLQGFSDDHLDTDPPLSDGAKYRLAGNSVALPVVTWILSRLAAVAATEEAGLSKSTVPTGRAGA
jgi:hypothetical protein